jgi:hypothetical protein
VICTSAEALDDAQFLVIAPRLPLSVGSFLSPLPVLVWCPH